MGAWSLCFGAGCGASTSGGAPDEQGREPPPGVELASAFGASGQRLAVMAYESDGAIAMSHIQDEALGMACAFATDAEGVARCFPTQEARVVYFDENCLSPAIYLQGGSALTEAAWVMEGDGIPEPTCPGQLPTAGRLYRVGERVYERTFGLPITIYEPQGGRCLPTWPMAKEDPPVHRLVPQADDELVPGTLVTRASSQGYRVSGLVAADGAVLNLGVRLEDGTPCALQRDGVCVPEPLARLSSSLSSDEVCGAPVFVSASPLECGMPHYGLMSSDNEPTRLAQLAPLPPTQGDLEYTCKVTAFVDAFGSRADSAVEAPPAVAELRMLGHGALRAPAFQLPAPGGNYLLPSGKDGPSFTQDGQPCAPTPMTDGTLRCIRGDDEVYETGFFGDGDCRKRVLVRQSARLQEFDDAIVARSFVAIRGEGGRIESLRAVKRHAGGAFEVDEGGACRPANATNLEQVFGPDLSMALAVDAPIPLDTVPRLELERL